MQNVGGVNGLLLDPEQNGPDLSVFGLYFCTSQEAFFHSISLRPVENTLKEADWADNGSCPTRSINTTYIMFRKPKADSFHLHLLNNFTFN